MKVKSCYKLESGLRLGQEGIHACQLGPFSSPIYFTPEEASLRDITKADIIEKRKWIFDLLNSKDAETPCKQCDMVVEKEMADVRFDQLGHIDLAAATTCTTARAPRSLPLSPRAASTPSLSTAITRSAASRRT